MLRICLSAVTVSLLALGVDLGAAQAQSRVFVAAQGSDLNPCSFALPCRTFQHAHDVVAANGEIDVLDPAGYGSLTITKSISIQGHGFAGLSVASGGNGIEILAGAVVHLNGLLIEGNGVGAVGILFQSGRVLVVENCIVRNMSDTGIVVNPFAAITPTLSVSNSYFSSNQFAGISIQPISSQGAGVIAAIERTAFYDTGSSAVRTSAAGGNGAINVAVTDSIAANGGTAFLVVSGAGHPAVDLSLTRTTIAGNSAGVVATSANTTVRLSQTTIVANATGYSIGVGGTIFSYGDNTIDNNGSNTGTLTAATKQ
jgi:hypothetical protein